MKLENIVKNQCLFIYLPLSVSLRPAGLQSPFPFQTPNFLDLSLTLFWYRFAYDKKTLQSNSTDFQIMGAGSVYISVR